MSDVLDFLASQKPKALKEIKELTKNLTFVLFTDNLKIEEKDIGTIEIFEDGDKIDSSIFYSFDQVNFFYLMKEKKNNVTIKVPVTEYISFTLANETSNSLIELEHCSFTNMNIAQKDGELIVKSNSDTLSVSLKEGKLTYKGYFKTKNINVESGKVTFLGKE